MCGFESTQPDAANPWKKHENISRKYQLHNRNLSPYKERLLACQSPI